MNEFGITLKAIRKSRKMTQEELAKKVGVDRTYISNLENGNKKPTDDLLFKLADVLVAERLFLSAGKLIPKEFEQKYPRKEFNIAQVNLPESLKKLLDIYKARTITLDKKRNDLEEKIRDLENFLTSEEDYYQEVLGDVKVFLENNNSTSNTEDLNTFFYNVKSLIESQEKINTLNDEIRNLLWELYFTCIGNPGQTDAVYDIWKEIKSLIQIDQTKFLTEFLELCEQDKPAIEIISDILKIRKEKSKVPTSRGKV